MVVKALTACFSKPRIHVTLLQCSLMQLLTAAVDHFSLTRKMTILVSVSDHWLIDYHAAACIA